MHSPFKLTSALLALLIFAALLVGCSADTAQQPTPGGKLQLVATTTLVGDVVARIGGQAIQLGVLLPTGADPHSFDPTPQDIARIAQAQAVFANGVGLEQFLERLLQNAGGQARLVEVSQGIALLESTGDEHGAAEAHPDEGDPHVWLDPHNVMRWVENIQAALGELDPANADLYRSNAEAYLAELAALDDWIQQQVALVPPGNRKLVTDHLVFTYFAERYGFQQVGAILPGYSTLSQPSAQELAALEDAIRLAGVRAVFVGNTINPALARQVAGDTGIKLVFVYTGSLTAPGGDAGSYLEYMRYNVSAIVSALK